MSEGDVEQGEQNADDSVMKQVQYSIRRVPAHVDKALRLRAQREKKSLNAVILDVLQAAATLESEPRTYHDLDYSWF